MLLLFEYPFREFYCPADVDFLIGDSSKAQEVLGWQPEVPFSQLVDMMVESDLRALERWGV
jgi:GDPmannose 4,6-dehydratase